MLTATISFLRLKAFSCRSSLRNTASSRTTRHSGSVNLLPTEIKNQNVGKIEHHKEKPLIIVDVNGVSSATSAELLTKQGFEKVYVLKDGLAAWAGANLPLVKKHK